MSGGNCPGRQLSGGNCPGGNYPGGNCHGGQLSCHEINRCPFVRSFVRLYPAFLDISSLVFADFWHKDAKWQCPKCDGARFSKKKFFSGRKYRKYAGNRRHQLQNFVNRKAENQCLGTWSFVLHLLVLCTLRTKLPFQFTKQVAKLKFSKSSRFKTTRS